MSLDNATEKPLLRVPTGGSLDSDDPDPDPDPYGWEAELEKHAVLPPPPPAAVGLGLGMGVGTEFCYRRAGGAKRTLLQRVLSFGPGSAATATGNHTGGKEG
jgi:hypothetical protein